MALSAGTLFTEIDDGWMLSITERKAPLNPGLNNTFMTVITTYVIAPKASLSSERQLFMATGDRGLYSVLIFRALVIHLFLMLRYLQPAQ